MHSLILRFAEKQTPSSGGLLDGFQRYVLAQKPSKDVGALEYPEYIFTGPAVLLNYLCSRLSQG
jgi:hypothetical protein